jgi:hypothetical protein
MEERQAQEKRLKEIQGMTLEGLSDDAVLELLAERKHLENVIAEYQKADKAAQADIKKRKKLEKEEHEIEEKIEHLNEEIRPDKGDDELLTLIQERKVLEGELLSIEKELGGMLPGQVLEPAEEIPTPLAQAEPVATQTSLPTNEHQPEQEVSREPLFKDAGFGNEGIRLDELKETGEFDRYVDELEASRDSLSSFLQSLPRKARANKNFMLRVALIDPAYAMHYAVDELRRDEDFHIKIAATRNNRGSGNALAEMDPEMRTDHVVLAATREDFRNVRFVTTDMALHDEILLAAKKDILEKASQLKEAINLKTFIPKILQQDQAFMEQIEKIVEKK